MAAARHVRIHLPWTVIFLPALLTVCVMPIASAGGAWAIAYALPVGTLLVLAFAGTTATGTHLSSRWLHGRVRLAWDEVDRLEFPGARWAVAVTQSGRRVVLPGVRPADLPRIVSAAGGRLFLRRQPGRTAEPETAQPGTPEPEMAEPGGVQPKMAEPEMAEPEVSGVTEITEPTMSEPGATVSDEASAGQRSG